MTLARSSTIFASASAPKLSSFLSLPNKYLATFARNSITRVLEQHITVGRLTLVESNVPTKSYGSLDYSKNDVSITVVNDNFWVRVLISGDLGFSEAYMAGDVEVSNLKAVMDLWLDNQSGMKKMSSVLARITSTLSSFLNGFFGQTRFQAQLNAIASYDQSNELFKAFLSREMMYSCALWGDAEGGVRGDIEGNTTSSDLESAQTRKIHTILQQALVKPGHRILEFGSGWGGLAIEAARFFGCVVDTLTLSVEQKCLAEERIREAGLGSQITVHLLDYREIPASFEKSFDAFISVEMLEHVGSKYYETYFRLVDFALKPKNATVVVSSSTFPESRYSTYQAEDFMRRYMWPNSSLPCATTLITAAYQGSKGRLTLERVENHSAHYPRTLREWGRRLEANLTQEKIAKEYPALWEKAEYDAFKRKWQYLFAYAGAGFAKGYITCHMLTFIRENDPPFVACD